MKEHNNGVVSVALAFLAVLAAVLFLPRAYAINDDLGLAFMLERGVHPSLFSTYLSELLIRLYRWQSQLAWYALYHYLMTAIALGLSFQLILRHCPMGAWRWLALAAIALIFLNFITQLTFTHTAVLLCGLSLLTLADRLVSRQEDKTTALLLGCLFMLGWASRFEGPKSVLFLLPVLLACLWPHRSRWKVWLPVLALFLAPFILVAALEKAHPLYTPAERAYAEYALSSGKFLGMRFTRSSQDTDALAQAGWSPVDLGMLKHFMFVDERKFSKARIDKAGQSIPPMLKASLLDLLQPANLLSRKLEYFKEVWFGQRNVSFLFLGLSLFGLLILRRKRQKLLILGNLLLVITGSFALHYLIRFPERLGFPLFFVLSLGLLVYILRQVGKNGLKVRWPALLVLLIPVVIAVGTTLYETGKMPKNIRKYRTDQAYLSQFARDRFILRSPNVIFNKWADPLKTGSLEVSDMGPGWLLFSLPFYQRLERFGLSKGSELLPWMARNPHGIFITKKMHIPLIQAFVRETYRLETTPVFLGHLPAHTESLVYRLTMK